MTHRSQVRTTTSPFSGIFCLAVLLLAATAVAEQATSSTWPQPYMVRQNKSTARLVLSTPYYEIQHDLRRGAAISGIKLTYGKGTNLLLAPMQTSVRDARDIVFSDVFDRKPRVRRTHGSGLTEVVEVEVRLLDQRGAASGFGKLFDGKF